MDPRPLKVWQRRPHQILDYQGERSAVARLHVCSLAGAVPAVDHFQLSAWLARVGVAGARRLARFLVVEDSRHLTSPSPHWGFPACRACTADRPLRLSDAYPRSGECGRVNQMLELTRTREKVFIDPDQILWCEAAGSGAKIHLTDDQDLTVEQNPDEIDSRLQEHAGVANPHGGDF
jgi:hypothetical protein